MQYNIIRNLPKKLKFIIDTIREEHEIYQIYSLSNKERLL